MSNQITGLPANISSNQVQADLTAKTEIKGQTTETTINALGRNATADMSSEPSTVQDSSKKTESKALPTLKELGEALLKEIKRLPHTITKEIPAKIEVLCAKLSLLSAKLFGKPEDVNAAQTSVDEANLNEAKEHFTDERIKEFQQSLRDGSALKDLEEKFEILSKVVYGNHERILI